MSDPLAFALGLVLAGLTIASLALGPARWIRRLVALYLVFAGLIYVGFALVWGDAQWVLIEAAGAAAYAVCAALGLRRHPLWLAVGWALHPLWDVGIHALGPGADVAPRWYAIACVSFDLLMAGWIARRDWGAPCTPPDVATVR